MRTYGDMGYVVVRCSCGWYVTMGAKPLAANPHVGRPVPLNDHEPAWQHFRECEQATPPETEPGEDASA